MGLKKAENQVRVMLADTIVAMCRNTLNYHGEVCVEGLLGITLDKEEIFLVSINQTITNPEVLRQRAENEANDAHGRKRRSEEDESDSESSGSEAQSEAQSEQSKSKKSRRKRRKRKTSTQSSTSASDSESEKKSSKDHDTSGEIPEIHRLDDSDKSDNETNNDDNSTTNDLINHAPVVPIFPTGHAFPGVFPGHPFVPTTPLQVPHQVPGHGGQSSAVSIKSEKSDDDIKSEHADSNSSAAQQYSDFVAGAAAQFPAFNQLHLSNLAAGENSNPFHNASLQLMASQQQVAAESGVPQPGPSNPGRCIHNQHRNNKGMTSEYCTSMEVASEGYNTNIGYNASLHNHQVSSSPLENPQVSQDASVCSPSWPSGNSKKLTRSSRVQCELCKKVLPSSAHLRIHFRVHTGDKPYSCSLCGRGFNQKGNLCRHLAKVHGVEKNMNSH